jgi:P-type Mg2+ transporter
VVATGARTEFGSIAAGLSTHQLDTEFQIGLRSFSMLLVYLAGTLTTSIFVIDAALRCLSVSLPRWSPWWSATSA